MSDRLTVIVGDCRERLKELPDNSVNCCVSSPPYWQLRDYNADGQIGHEETPEQYVESLAGVFREVRRVLRKDGTLWLNLGDTFASSGGHRDEGADGRRGAYRIGQRPKRRERPSFRRDRAATGGPAHKGSATCKPKDMIGIPWLVAFALRADGWFLRQYIPWIKRNAMPDSAKDRPQSVCETVFLLSKSRFCYYDYDAIKLPTSQSYRNDRRWKTGFTEWFWTRLLAPARSVKWPWSADGKRS